MLDAQLNYHKSSMQLLEALQQDWGQGYVQRTSDPVRPPLLNTISRSSTTSGTARRNTNMSNNSETDDMYGADESYHQGSPYGTSAPRRPSMRQGSQDNIPSTIRRQPSYSSTGRSEDSYGSQSRFAPPPPMPRSKRKYSLLMRSEGKENLDSHYALQLHQPKNKLKPYMTLAVKTRMNSICALAMS